MTALCCCEYSVKRVIFGWSCLIILTECLCTGPPVTDQQYASQRNKSFCRRHLKTMSVLGVFPILYMKERTFLLVNGMTGWMVARDLSKWKIRWTESYRKVITAAQTMISGKFQVKLFSRNLSLGYEQFNRSCEGLVLCRLGFHGVNAAVINRRRIALEIDIRLGVATLWFISLEVLILPLI